MYFNIINKFQKTAIKKIILSRNFLRVFKFYKLRSFHFCNRGKNNQGVYTVYGKCKRERNIYNYVDYYRCSVRLPGMVVANNYDNYRTGFFGLVKYLNGSFSYVLLPNGLNIGSVVQTTNHADKLLPGFCKPLYSIPLNSKVYNVEFFPKQGGKIARAAGTYCLVKRYEGKFVLVQLVSGKLVRLSKYCLATLGQVSNKDKHLEIFTRFRFTKKLGYRSTVSGEAKNAIDHPHGGGTKGGKPKMNP